MKPIEKRNINNPREWVIDGTNIFIIPQAVVQSNDPTTSNYTIRHGAFNQEGGRLTGIVTDFIENGYDDVGGFVTFQDVVDYMKRESDFCEGIYNYMNKGMTDHAADLFLECNANNPLFAGGRLTKKTAINKLLHTPLNVLKNRAIAWKQAYSDCSNAIKNGVCKDDIHLGSFAN